MKNSFTFNELVSSLRDVDIQLSAQENRAVNVSLTLRNWMVGRYISEYELKGLDRAQYGEKLLAELARELKVSKLSNCNKRQLYDYINLYRIYHSNSEDTVGTIG